MGIAYQRLWIIWYPDANLNTICSVLKLFRFSYPYLFLFMLCKVSLQKKLRFVTRQKIETYPSTWAGLSGKLAPQTVLPESRVHLLNQGERKTYWSLPNLLTSLISSIFSQILCRVCMMSAYKNFSPILASIVFLEELLFLLLCNSERLLWD